MTLAAIWIEERTHGNQPLCFASDSRTTPGPVDGVTKVILFGREDVAAVWAGDFRYASILASHLDAVFTASDAMRRRDIDVARAFRQAVVTVKNHLDTSMTPAVPAFQRNPDAQLPERTTLVAGGYSVVEAAHMLFRIDWTPHDRRWKLSVTRADPTQLVFIGDERKTAKTVAKRARAHRSGFENSSSWHMEPLAAIHLACIDGNSPTIGGDLQLAKAFMHGSARAYGFVDPILSDAVSVRGTCVDARAARELAGSGLLIDLSTWLLTHGSFTARRKV
jgi:hypothetical protein